MQVNKLISTTGKTVCYPVDGTGRDTYIVSNNGGFFARRKPLLKEIGTFPQRIKSCDKAPVLSGKSVIYQSDGSGRDSYVT